MSDRDGKRFQWLFMVFFVFFMFDQVCINFVNHADAVGLDNSDVSQMAVLTAELEHAVGDREITLLLSRGEIYRSLGHYVNAKNDFESALAKAQELQTPLLEIVAMQSLGYICFLKKETEQGKALLGAALEKSSILNHPSPSIAASCANRMGNVLSAENQKQEALKMYEDALGYLKIFHKDEDPALGAAINRNIAHVITDRNAALEHLSRAFALARRVQSPGEQVKLFLEIGEEAAVLAPDPSGDAFRYSVLERALGIAEKMNEPQFLSLAAGKLGALYEARGRIDEAVALTEQAVGSAQIIRNHDLLMQWQWQWGRLLRAKGDRERAISAYQRALFHVDYIRQDMAYDDGCTTFRSTLGPIYTGLADMLLQQSGETEDDAMQQHLLKQARQAVEGIKQSELRDYFKDPCIDAMSREIEFLSPSTAVIYPVIFPDRLEILADIAGRLHRRTCPVKKQELEGIVIALTSNLRNNLFHKKSGKRICSWLIEPLEDLFAKNDVNTLIFVPDGVFRMLPLAALWNGEGFLARKYAVVTEPGLTLLNPEPLPRGEMNTLLAGMSSPGPVVRALPLTLRNQLSQVSLTDVNRGIRGLSVKHEKRPSAGPSDEVEKDEVPSSSKGNKGSEQDLKHIKAVLALPGVAQEIESLSHNLHGRKLMNDEFMLERFSREIEQQNFRIIHVASHGFFGGSPEENFIMTYDKILNMNLLESYIKPKRFARHPVELITLSACQTAEGDDRSPLGLAGVALKSGARSVLGSLWPVSDAATKMLLTMFYSNLKDAGMSKAQALQKAQIELIRTERFQHPFYWSAFILVGNWL